MAGDICGQSRHMGLAANTHSLRLGVPAGLDDASSPSRVEEGFPMAAAMWSHHLSPRAPQGTRASISPLWGLWVHSKEADPPKKGVTGLGKRVFLCG